MSMQARGILIMVLVSILNLVSYAGDNNLKWKECSVDSDCLPVVELCGGAESINKKFIDDYYYYRSKIVEKALCHGFREGEWQDVVIAKCEKKKCIIKQSSNSKIKTLKSLSNTELVSLKLLYNEIEKNVSRREYRNCFYNILKLKQQISSYENSDNHFYLCKQNIK